MDSYKYNFFLLMHAIPGGPFTAEKSLPPYVLHSIEERYKLMTLYINSMVIIYAI